MAPITSAARKRLPKTSFGLVKNGKGMFPLTDKEHDILAEQFTSQAVKAGHITPAQAQLIDAEARQRLAAMKRGK